MDGVRRLRVAIAVRRWGAGTRQRRDLGASALREGEEGESFANGLAARRELPAPVGEDIPMIRQYSPPRFRYETIRAGNRERLACVGTVPSARSSVARPRTGVVCGRGQGAESYA